MIEQQGRRQHFMRKIPFKDVFVFWLKLGFISFGGPAGQIAIMNQYLVEKKKWISESKFLHALNYCMLLPGPEAQQMATYTGWLMHGAWGGITAGTLFILPSVFIMMGLSALYALQGNTAPAVGIFMGVKPAVVAIVLLALWNIGGKALKRPIDLAIAIVALSGLLFFNVPYPVIILGSMVVGYLYIKITEGKNAGGEQVESEEDESEFVINKTTLIPHAQFKWQKATVQAVAFLALWCLPFVAFFFLSGDFKFWKQLSLFFTQSALFTFGGAYSILVYVAQVAVQKLHWLSQSQMVDGLAMGETTPGPLIMVLTYVGFMGAFHHFGNSVLAGCVGLLLTTYFTFLPSFLFVLVGAPFIEKAHDNANLKTALSFVTAAVVGVIGNLAVFTAKAVVFPARLSFQQVNWVALVWVTISVIAMKRFGVNMIVWILFSAGTGLLLHWATGA